MEIQNYVIDIKGRSLQDRLRLRQVLLDNGQHIHYTPSLLEVGSRPNYGLSDSMNEWTILSNLANPNISLEDFIQKFKKSDEVRNLAFTTNQPDGFTLEQIEAIIKFTGDYDDSLEDVVGQKILADDGSDFNFMGSSLLNPEHLEVAFEDVFPEAVEPEFKYPIYKKLTSGKERTGGLVIKFTGLTEGEIVVLGDSTYKKVGEEITNLAHHTYPGWEDWDPQFDYDTIMQPKTVVSCTTESEANELLYWAHQQGFKWAGASGCYLDRNNFDIYEHIAYDVKAGTYGRLEFYEEEGYTILTMDEARNGKDYDKPFPIEPTIDKPLLSDLLKQHGAYEKFLTNLSSKDSKQYKRYLDRQDFYDCVSYAFLWEASNEGHTFWSDVQDNIGQFECTNSVEQIECVNDVRAPDDVEYWEEQYQAGNKFWYVDPSDNEVMESLDMAPGKCTNFTNWYAEEPTWLTKLNNNTKEQTMNEQTAKVGDKVICTTGCRYSKIGAIETITKVAGESIWVSNTNSLSWTLGINWELYDGTADAGTTPITKEQTMDTIEIKLNGQTIETGATPSKLKSDFKRKPSIIAIYHTAYGREIESKRFKGKSALADAQAHLVTMIAEHPNAKMTPYTVGKSSKLKYQFEAAK